MDKNTASKTKIVSIVISLGIIATLIIGVISVVRSVNSNRNNENNIVNLNETQENVAIKTEDVTDDVLGNIDDELQEANAGASMAVDTDNISVIKQIILITHIKLALTMQIRKLSRQFHRLYHQKKLWLRQ